MQPNKFKAGKKEEKEANIKKLQNLPLGSLSKS